MSLSTIARGVRYATRASWGADTTLPRLGMPLVRRDQRYYAITHHTVGVDADASPNVWETDAECYANMQRLQTIRPDLGLDVPYNFVGYLMSDDTLLVCEGRGLERSGAHTKGVDDRGEYYNVAGIALAIAGNFEVFTQGLASWFPAMSRFWSWLRYDKAMVHLGTRRIGPRQFAGHRDAVPWAAGTACPGQYVYDLLGELRFINPIMGEEIIDMATAEELRAEIAALRAVMLKGFVDLSNADKQISTTLGQQILNLYDQNAAIKAELDALDKRLDAAAAGLGG